MFSNLAVLGLPRRSVFEPAYLRLFRSGELAERARSAHRHLQSCDLCARYCRVERRQSIRGAVCRTGDCGMTFGDWLRNAWKVARAQRAKRSLIIVNPACYVASKPTVSTVAMKRSAPDVRAFFAFGDGSEKGDPGRAGVSLWD